MTRYLRIFICMLPLTVFGALGIEDEYECDDGPSGRFTEISYAGMTIQCNRGCGDPYSDQTFRVISRLLSKSIEQNFSPPISPIYLGWGNIVEVTKHPFPFKPWIGGEDYTYIVYDWEKSKGFYLSGNPRKRYSFTTYPQFLELATALRNDIRYYSIDVYYQKMKYYESLLPLLRKMDQEGDRRMVQFCEDGQLDFDEGWTGRNKSIPTFYNNLKREIKEINERLFKYKEYHEQTKEKIDETIREIDLQYRQIFIWCLEWHQPEGIRFRGAIEEFIGGDFYEAIELIRWLIETAEQHHVEETLLSKLYLLKGQVQSEYGLFAEAILGLTTAIHKNPEMKEAYFERAAAYFQLGKFDLALEDYLASKVRPTFFESSTQLGLGISAGILTGAKDSAIEFIPSIVGAAQGLGVGIWALTKHPIAISQEFAAATVEFIQYIRSNSIIEVIQDIVPELKELIQNFDQLNDFQKGKLFGHIIGKYGLDIFLVKKGTSYLKSLQNLKKANKTLTLEALASSENAQPLLAETEKRWFNYHIEMIKKGEVPIHEARQGKHRLGHKNYEELVRDGKHPSILTHPDPQKLFIKYAGTGIKESPEFFGMQGYKEVADFKEFIGYSVSKQGEKTATTFGKIHYAKDGVHIVPFVKRQ